MKWIPFVVVVLVACKKEPAKRRPEPESPGTPVPAKAAKPTDPALPVAGKHVAPSGTIAGTEFAPNLVLLLDDSDGGKLAFYTASERELTNRPRCDEPIGSGTTAELTRYEKIEAWTVGAPITSELAGWSANGLPWKSDRKGTAKVTLTKKDPKTFAVSGTIELADDGIAYSGPFEGEYCPTKVVVRGDKPPPLGTRAWSMAPITDAKDLPATPLEAIVAGLPAKVPQVTFRVVTWADGSKHQQFQFYTAAPPDPCDKHVRSNHWHLDDPDATAFHADTFLLDLAAAPVAGSVLTGNYTGDAKKEDEITGSEVSVFEPDGFRGWRYAQYFSAALAVDAVTDSEIRARVQLSLPDQGKSMLVGSFTAKRCPPLD